MKACISVRNLFFSLLLITIFFPGCKKNIDDDSSAYLSGTLKAEVQEKTKDIQWVEPLEGDRLVQSLFHTDTIDVSIKLSPLVYLASKQAAETDPVYPYLEDFGSLNTFSMNKEIRTVLDGFCKALCQFSGGDEFMHSDSIFELALLKKDLKEEWESSFGRAFPVLETNSDAETEEAEKKSELFNSFFYGEPFEMQNLYEVPVRFLNNYAKVDIIIFFFKQNKEWKINQFKITKMEHL